MIPKTRATIPRRNREAKKVYTITIAIVNSAYPAKFVSAESSLMATNM